MGKPIQFTLEGKAVSLELGSKITRESLYGKTLTVITDRQGQPLQEARVTQAGEILAPNMLLRLRMDSQGSLEEAEQTRCDGKEMPLQESSFKELRPLAKVKESALFEFAVEGVYPVETTLPQGAYKGQFNYRASPEPADCILWIPEEGKPAFLLVGKDLHFSFLGQGLQYDLFDAADTDEDSGDFDFDF